MRKPNAAGESNRDDDGDGRVCDGVRDDGCYRNDSLLKIVLSLKKRGRFILMKIYTRPSRKKALDHFAR